MSTQRERPAEPARHDPREPGAATGTGAGTETAYHGQSLGLPEQGPGRMAGWGIRIGALFLDWIFANLVALVITRDPQVFQPPQTPLDLIPLGVFALEVLLGTAFPGASVAQRMVGISVVRLESGKPAGLARSALRTLLILLVIPPLITDADYRGLHDRVAGTVVVRTN